jgi:hypothetical protein
MKTNKIILKNLHNEEHFQFQTEFKDSVTKAGAETLQISDAFAIFLSFYAQEQEALQVIRKSATTGQLANADTDRDVIYRGLVDAIKSALNHFDVAKQAAAARFMIVFEQYGNVARKSYDEETAAITKLVGESRKGYAADVQSLGLTDWFNELNAKNQAFDMLMKGRYSEDAEKTELRMKQVRTEVDAAYRDIANRIDALILINGTKGFETFVNELNSRVDRYNNILVQRKGRNAKANDTAKMPAK